MITGRRKTTTVARRFPTFSTCLVSLLVVFEGGQAQQQHQQPMPGQAQQQQHQQPPMPMPGQEQQPPLAQATAPWYETLPAVAMDYKVIIDPGKEDCYFQFVNPGATFYASAQVPLPPKRRLPSPDLCEKALYGDLSCAYIGAERRRRNGRLRGQTSERPDRPSVPMESQFRLSRPRVHGRLLQRLHRQSVF